MNSKINTRCHATLIAFFVFCIGALPYHNAYADEKDDVVALDFLPAFLAAMRDYRAAGSVSEICKTGSPTDIVCNDGLTHYFVVFVDDEKFLKFSEFITPEGEELTAGDCSAESIETPKTPPIDQLPPGIADAILNPPPGKYAVVKVLKIVNPQPGPTVVPVRLRAYCRPVS